MQHLAQHPGQQVEIAFYGDVVNTGGVNVYGIVNAPPMTPPADVQQAAAWLFGTPVTVSAKRFSGWLDPRAGVVEPHQRPEADALVHWCVADTAEMVRLVCAPGGQGKTVLAEQVCQSLRDKGWLAGLVALPPVGWRADQAAALTGRVPHLEAWSRTLAAAEHATTFAGVEGVLLVVDYADSNADVAAALLDTLAAASRRDNVRLLLLARGAGPWWTNLAARGGRGLVDPAVLRLPPLHQSLAASPQAVPAQAARLWQEAADAFTARAISEGLLPHDHQAPEATPATAPQPFTTTLDLYADALVHVLDQTPTAATSDGDRSNPIGYLLRVHEYRQLASALTAAAPGADLGTEPMRVLDVVCLRPAHRSEDAARALTALPEFAALTPAVLKTLVHGLASMYPGETSSSVWSAPKPDRLTDLHLLSGARDAHSDDDWTSHLISVAAGGPVEEADEAAAQTVGTLLRALSAPEAPTRYQQGAQRLRHAMTALLRAAPANYLPALVIADHDEQFVPAMLETIDDPATGMDVLRATDKLLNQLPVPRQRQAGLHLSRRLVAVGPPSDPPSDPLESRRYLQNLIDHSRRLAEAGYSDDALAAAQNTMSFLEQVRADDHETTALHALALNNLGSRLIEHRRTTEALTPLAQAVTLRRGLAETDPHRYLPDLAAALTNQVACLLALGHTAQSAQAASEAVTCLTGQTPMRPAHVYRLAVAWGTLSDTRCANGHIGEAVQAATQAIDLLTTLVQQQPFAYRASLAAARLRLAAYQTMAPRVGAARRKAAIQLARQAVDTFTQLSTMDATAYRLDLVRAWQTLAICHSRTHPTQGLDAIGKALEILKQSSGPTAGLLLASCLSTQSLLHIGARQTQPAIASAQTATTLFENAAAGGHTLTRELAATHSNLAYVLHTAGRHDQAVSAAEQAVAFQRHQQETASVASVVSVETADTLANLALCLAGAGQTTRAADAQAGAVELYLSAAADDPIALTRLPHAQADLQRLRDSAPQATGKLRLKGRFRRHWPLTPVQHLLPGVAGFWAIDLAPRDPRTHRLREELLAWLDRTPRRNQSPAGNQPERLPVASATTPIAASPITATVATAAIPDEQSRDTAKPWAPPTVSSAAAAGGNPGVPRPPATLADKISTTLNRLTFNVTRPLTAAPGGEVSAVMQPVSRIVALGVPALLAAIMALTGGPEKAIPANPPPARETLPDAGSKPPQSPPDPGQTPSPSSSDPAALPTQPSSSPGIPPSPSTTPTDVPPPRNGSPVWGYASAHEDDYYLPIGEPMELDHRFQYGTWRHSTDPAVSSQFATGTRTGTGRYRVRLPGLASPRGITHAQHYLPPDYTAISCQLTKAYADGADQIAEIGCFDATGAPKNLAFMLTYIGASDGAAPMVSARYDKTSGTAQGAQVSRTGVGNYVLHSAGSFNGRGAVTLTAVGETAAHCANTGIKAGGGVQLTIACHAPGGAPVDTGWMLSYVEQIGPHHDPAAPAAYATIDGYSANPSALANRSWASNSEIPTVMRTRTGIFQIDYAGIGNPKAYPSDVVFVTAIGPETRYCLVWAWNSHYSGPALRVLVRCYDGAGAPADAIFNIAYLRSY